MWGQEGLERGEARSGWALVLVEGGVQGDQPGLDPGFLEGRFSAFLIRMKLLIVLLHLDQARHQGHGLEAAGFAGRMGADELVCGMDEPPLECPHADRAGPA